MPKKHKRTVGHHAVAVHMPMQVLANVPVTDVRREKIIRFIKLLGLVMLLIGIGVGLGYLLSGFVFTRMFVRTPRERQTEDDKWLWEEITPVKSEKVVQAGVCLKAEIDFNSSLNPQCFPVSDKKIMQGLNSASIIARHNKQSPYFALPANAKKEFQSMFSKPNKPFVLKNKEVADKITVDRLKEQIKYRLAESSEIAKQLAMIALNGKNPEFVLYDFYPYDPKRVVISARNDYRSAQVKFFKEAEISLIIPHELGHKSAVEISHHGNPVDGFAFAQAFPCEQEDEFLPVWRQELEAVIALKSKLRAKKTFPLSPDIQTLFDVATTYEPTFCLHITQDDMATLEQLSLLELNKILNLKTMLADIKYMFMPFLSLDNITDNAMFDKLLATSNYQVKIKYIHYQADIPGTAILKINPIEMDVMLKARYLIQAFEVQKAFIDGIKHFGKCQEAYASMLELNEKILRKLMPKSLAYIHDKFAEYSARNVNEIKLTK